MQKNKVHSVLLFIVFQTSKLFRIAKAWKSALASNIHSRSGKWPHILPCIWEQLGSDAKGKTKECKESLMDASAEQSHYRWFREFSSLLFDLFLIYFSYHGLSTEPCLLAVSTSSAGKKLVRTAEQWGINNWMNKHVLCLLKTTHLALPSDIICLLF